MENQTDQTFVTPKESPPPYTPSPTLPVSDEKGQSFTYTNLAMSTTLSQPETPVLDNLSQILEQNEHFVLSRSALRVSLMDPTEKRVFFTVRQEKNITKFCAGTMESVILEAEEGQLGAKRVVTVYNSEGVIVGTIHIDCQASTVIVEVKDKLGQLVLRVAPSPEETSSRSEVYKIVETGNDGEVGRIWEKSGKTNLKIQETINMELKALVLVTANVLSQKDSLYIPIEVEGPSISEDISLSYWDQNCGHILYWSCWGFSGLILIALIISTFTVWI